LTVRRGRFDISQAYPIQPHWGKHPRHSATFYTPISSSFLALSAAFADKEVDAMSTTESQKQPPPHAASVPSNDRRTGDLHRIRTVRQQQGISLRCAARRLKLSVEQVTNLEKGTSDMPLSMLYEWQNLLDVPLAELLVDGDGPLSEPVLKRARLVRLMKTAAAIHEMASSDPLKRMSRMLVDQLIEMMPELREVSPWHAIGQRRTADEVGRIAEQPLPDSLFGDTLFHL
jgi:transcriptional regulator with XRE-family HTH domain